MKRVFKFIFSKETIFVLFLYAGFFKEAIPFPVDLTIFLMLLSILLATKELINGKAIPRVRSEAAFFYISIAVWVGISILYSVNPFAYDKGLRFIVITGWSFLGVLLIIKDTNSLKRFFLGFIWLGIITSIFAIKQYITGDRVGSVMVFGSDYLALGRVVGTAAVILFCNLLLKKMSLFERVFGYAVLLLMLTAMVVSGGRGPLLFLLLIFFIIIIFNIKLSKGFIFLAAIISSVIYTISKTNLLIFQTLVIRINHALYEIGGGDSISGRMDRFDKAIQMFGDSPIIGYGISSFTQIYNNGRSIEYPHNIFLELASELGLIGLILFLSMFFLALFRFFNKPKKDGEIKILAWISFSLLLYHFTNANVSGDIIGNRVFFTFLALIWIFNNIKARENSK